MNKHTFLCRQNMRGSRRAWSQNEPVLKTVSDPAQTQGKTLPPEHRHSDPATKLG
jgi:hypothetical protein